MRALLKSNKKNIVVLLMGVIFIIFTACQPNEVQDESGQEYNSIKSIELTESEKNLLGAAGVEKHFVFQYNLLDAQPKWADIWVDYYEMGEYINKLTSGGFALDEKQGEGRILLTVNDLPSDVMKREFVISLMGETGFTSGSISVDKRTGDITTAWETIDEKKVIFDENMILAVMVENKGEGTKGIDARIFDDDQQALRDVLENDYVYILMCRIR